MSWIGADWAIRSVITRITDYISIRTHPCFLASFTEKPTEKPTEKRSISVSVFSVSFLIPTETDRHFGEKPKNRPSHLSFSVHNPV